MFVDVFFNYPLIFDTQYMEQKIDLEGHRARLRGRFQKSGFEGFHEYEIVELLLTLCIPRRDVKNLAKRLFNHFGSIRGLLDASEQELRQVEGIGEVTPVALRIIRETANLYLRQTAEEKIVLNLIKEQRLLQEKLNIQN